MRPMPSSAIALLAAAASTWVGCKCSGPGGAGTGSSSASRVASGGPSPSVLPAVSVEPDGVELHEVAQHVPIIAAKGMYIMIRDKPDKKGARDLGYLRLGGAVQRSEAPVGKRNCEGDWYQVVPRGYACVDKDATVDRQDPIVRAASRRPDLSKPMPYAYGFVRAVLPLYLKVPNREEQLAVEFKLAEHLSWWKEQGHLNNKADQLGANDVFIDALGVPHDEAQVTRKSTEMGEGELFGGKTNDDPVPWWLDGGRKIPNVSPFQVPDFAVFADRARRHAGLTFVGSFRAGADSFDRRFGITEDLRLAPTSKVKPDIGPTFHGVTLGAERLVLPVAWIKSKDAKRYRIDGEKVRVYKKRATYRDVVQLTGKKQYLDRRLYYETNDGKWVRARDIAIAAAPEQMPPEAKRGDKWIDISIRQQVLVLWEGQTPVYATLVSTGQDMLGDPKTTKSTVLGRFRIQSKHVTTHMDSSEGLTRDSNDPEYGKTKRRGQGTFLLQHVPWVQYFKGSYALHATYWHDVFGTARSHGCVNVSPIDAHRVFFWTKPSLPKGWHGVYAEREEDGTLVFIHE